MDTANILGDRPYHKVIGLKPNSTLDFLLVNLLEINHDWDNQKGDQRTIVWKPWPDVLLVGVFQCIQKALVNMLLLHFYYDFQ